MTERRTNGDGLRCRREIEPHDAFAICGFIVGAAAIGALLSPLAVMCALLVIVFETTRRLLGSKRRKVGNPQ